MAIDLYDPLIKQLLARLPSNLSPAQLEQILRTQRHLRGKIVGEVVGLVQQHLVPEEEAKALITLIRFWDPATGSVGNRAQDDFRLENNAANLGYQQAAYSMRQERTEKNPYGMPSFESLDKEDLSRVLPNVPGFFPTFTAKGEQAFYAWSPPKPEREGEWADFADPEKAAKLVKDIKLGTHKPLAIMGPDDKPLPRYKSAMHMYGWDGKPIDAVQANIFNVGITSTAMPEGKVESLQAFQGGDIAYLKIPHFLGGPDVDLSFKDVIGTAEKIMAGSRQIGSTGDWDQVRYLAKKIKTVVDQYGHQSQTAIITVRRLIDSSGVKLDFLKGAIGGQASPRDVARYNVPNVGQGGRVQLFSNISNIKNWMAMPDRLISGVIASETQAGTPLRTVLHKLGLTEADLTYVPEAGKRISQKLLDACEKISRDPQYVDPATGNMNLPMQGDMTREGGWVAKRARWSSETTEMMKRVDPQAYQRAVNDPFSKRLSGHYQNIITEFESVSRQLTGGKGTGTSRKFDITNPLQAGGQSLSSMALGRALQQSVHPAGGAIYEAMGNILNEMRKAGTKIPAIASSANMVQVSVRIDGRPVVIPLMSAKDAAYFQNRDEIRRNLMGLSGDSAKQALAEWDRAKSRLVSTSEAILAHVGRYGAEDPAHYPELMSIVNSHLRELEKMGRSKTTQQMASSIFVQQGAMGMGTASFSLGFNEIALGDDIILKAFGRQIGDGSDKEKRLDAFRKYLDTHNIGADIQRQPNITDTGIVRGRIISAAGIGLRSKRGVIIHPAVASQMKGDVDGDMYAAYLATQLDYDPNTGQVTERGRSSAAPSTQGDVIRQILQADKLRGGGLAELSASLHKIGVPESVTTKFKQTLVEAGQATGDRETELLRQAHSMLRNMTGARPDELFRYYISTLSMSPEVTMAQFAGGQQFVRATKGYMGDAYNFNRQLQVAGKATGKGHEYANFTEIIYKANQDRERMSPGLTKFMDFLGRYQPASGGLKQGGYENAVGFMNRNVDQAMLEAMDGLFNSKEFAGTEEQKTLASIMTENEAVQKTLLEGGKGAVYMALGASPWTRADRLGIFMSTIRADVSARQANRLYGPNAMPSDLPMSDKDLRYALIGDMLKSMVFTLGRKKSNLHVLPDDVTGIEAMKLTGQEIMRRQREASNLGWRAGKGAKWMSEEVNREVSQEPEVFSFAAGWNTNPTTAREALAGAPKKLRKWLTGISPTISTGGIGDKELLDWAQRDVIAWGQLLHDKSNSWGKIELNRSALTVEGIGGAKRRRKHINAADTALHELGHAADFMVGGIERNIRRYHHTPTMAEAAMVSAREDVHREVDKMMEDPEFSGYLKEQYGEYSSNQYRQEVIADLMMAVSRGNANMNHPAAQAAHRFQLIVKAAGSKEEDAPIPGESEISFAAAWNTNPTTAREALAGAPNILRNWLIGVSPTINTKGISDKQLLDWAQRDVIIWGQLLTDFTDFKHSWGKIELNRPAFTVEGTGGVKRRMAGINAANTALHELGHAADEMVGGIERRVSFYQHMPEPMTGYPTMAEAAMVSAREDVHREVDKMIKDPEFSGYLKEQYGEYDASVYQQEIIADLMMAVSKGNANMNHPAAQAAHRFQLIVKAAGSKEEYAPIPGESEISFASENLPDRFGEIREMATSLEMAMADMFRHGPAQIAQYMSKQGKGALASISKGVQFGSSSVRNLINWTRDEGSAVKEGMQHKSIRDAAQNWLEQGRLHLTMPGMAPVGPDPVFSFAKVGAGITQRNWYDLFDAGFSESEISSMSIKDAMELVGSPSRGRSSSNILPTGSEAIGRQAQAVFGRQPPAQPDPLQRAHDEAQAVFGEQPPAPTKSMRSPFAQEVGPSLHGSTSDAFIAGGLAERARTAEKAEHSRRFIETVMPQIENLALTGNIDFEALSKGGITTEMGAHQALVATQGLMTGRLSANSMPRGSVVDLMAVAAEATQRNIMAPTGKAKQFLGTALEQAEGFEDVKTAGRTGMAMGSPWSPKAIDAVLGTIAKMGPDLKDMAEGIKTVSKSTVQAAERFLTPAVRNMMSFVPQVQGPGAEFIAQTEQAAAMLATKPSIEESEEKVNKTFFRTQNLRWAGTMAGQQVQAMTTAPRVAAQMGAAGFGTPGYTSYAGWGPSGGPFQSGAVGIGLGEAAYGRQQAMNWNNMAAGVGGMMKGPMGGLVNIGQSAGEAGFIAGIAAQTILPMMQMAPELALPIAGVAAGITAGFGIVSRNQFEKQHPDFGLLTGERWDKPPSPISPDLPGWASNGALPVPITPAQVAQKKELANQLAVFNNLTPQTMAGLSIDSRDTLNNAFIMGYTDPKTGANIPGLAETYGIDTSTPEGKQAAQALYGQYMTLGNGPRTVAGVAPFATLQQIGVDPTAMGQNDAQRFGGGVLANAAPWLAAAPEMRIDPTRGLEIAGSAATGAGAPETKIDPALFMDAQTGGANQIFKTANLMGVQLPSVDARAALGRSSSLKQFRSNLIGDIGANIIQAGQATGYQPGVAGRGILNAIGTNTPDSVTANMFTSQGVEQQRYDQIRNAFAANGDVAGAMALATQYQDNPQQAQIALGALGGNQQATSFLGRTSGNMRMITKETSGMDLFASQGALPGMTGADTLKTLIGDSGTFPEALTKSVTDGFNNTDFGKAWQAGGDRAGAQAMLGIQQQAAREQLGISQEQYAFQYQTTGPGEPGYVQQQRALALQQFQENWQLSQQQAQTSYQFQQVGMGHEQQMTGIQHGYAQQDIQFQRSQTSRGFGEQMWEMNFQMPYLTGRARRQAEHEKQYAVGSYNIEQNRETVLAGREQQQYSLQMQWINTEIGQQKVMHDLQMKGLQLEYKHFMENYDLEGKNIAMQQKWSKEQLDISARLLANQQASEVLALLESQWLQKSEGYMSAMMSLNPAQWSNLISQASGGTVNQGGMGSIAKFNPNGTRNTPGGQVAVNVNVGTTPLATFIVDTTTGAVKQGAETIGKQSTINAHRQ